MSDLERPAIPDAIAACRLIALARGLEPARTVPVAEALVAGGIRAFEVTLNSPDAFGAIQAVAARFTPDRLLVGAGTVLDQRSAEEAIDVGAAFLVMPHTDPALIRWAADRGIPAFPGALTPTEVLAAWRAGASAIKVFPASVGGPALVRELRGPFPAIPLVPTGGITVESLPGLFAAGAYAVALGSWLTGSGDPEAIEARARQALTAVREARGAAASGGGAA
jgi:2-dehydro-3-deoxyphosphogluconate aldolase / (4S)-4-hydroxy-2-oxoglutarate aldolase